MFARKIYSNVGTFILMGHDDLVGNKVGTLVSLAGYKIGNWLADGVGPLTQMVPIRSSISVPAGQARVMSRELVCRGGFETLLK